jgi:deoxyribodipyrimidine photo-lyase
MSNKTILVWFRNDLRVHDNEILSEAIRKADQILPVYCFDPYYFKTTDVGTIKTGAHRARFLVESVENLRYNLRQLGAELIVRTGNPAEVITQLAEEYQVSEVYHHREVSFEETRISEELEAALWKIKLNLKHFIGHTLYHKEDLPFPIKDIPDSFAAFKKKVERDSNVRPTLNKPEHIKAPPIADAGAMPTLGELGLTERVDDVRTPFKFTGGEDAGLKRLHDFIEQINQTGTYKINRNDAGAVSSRLSPWLATGCLSPRQVYWEIMQRGSGANHSNHPLVLELLWRDYFRFMFKKHGSTQFFNAHGFKSEAPAAGIKQDELFDKWKHGETGDLFVDAAIHELNATGYINNYNRQHIASFLVKELKVDWTKGAAYFEEELIDYSPASTWGNWAFIAGVGNDPRENRYFNVAKPAEATDKSNYVKTWLSEQPKVDLHVAKAISIS